MFITSVCHTQHVYFISLTVYFACLTVYSRGCYKWPIKDMTTVDWSNKWQMPRTFCDTFCNTFVVHWLTLYICNVLYISFISLGAYWNNHDRTLLHLIDKVNTLLSQQDCSPWSVYQMIKLTNSLQPHFRHYTLHWEWEEKKV